MARIRKYGGAALLILALVVGVQIGASFFVKTRHTRTFLLARLQSAFGRPVEANDFSIQVLPIPELQMDRVTIGEDPAFGREYFLRADRMNARISWLGLLRGRVELGNMSLTRPSLILVRNTEGRWNLEDWLPPVRANTLANAGAGVPQKSAPSTHRLEIIEFDEGRINFKMGDEKKPFAFINVSGSVEQVSAGRWRLRLEAEPWRSGVPLQSTGTLQVVGDVAGTSARLQPAEIQVHWGKVSLADLFRLITGNDSGVRGEFALDGKASVGTEPIPADTGVSNWKFELEARATQLHRWDLAERSDNPKVNVHLKGVWYRAKDEARAEELRVELPRSTLSGAAVLQTANPENWKAQFKSVAMQAGDLLAWYRAFQPGVGEELALSDFIKGNMSVGGDLSARGWPPHWGDGALTSEGGTLRVPGLKESQIGPFRASFVNGVFLLDGLRLKLGADTASGTSTRSVTAPENSAAFRLVHDSEGRRGSIGVTLHLADAEHALKVATAFGHRLDQGWEYTGSASGFSQWEWDGRLKTMRRNGRIDLAKSRLAVVGLNLPLKIEQLRLDWSDGRRSATIGKVEAFGANWTGTIAQTGEAAEERLGGIESRTISKMARADGEEGYNWQFQLHADRLDAAELDRWFGPRARPNWWQRLLPSLLGQSVSDGKASELLRRVSVEGDLAVDGVTVEKFKLVKAQANMAFRDLQLQVRHAEAQWAGGNVRGQITARFSPVPRYEVTAEVDRANLAQLPWPARWAERWGGTASGTIQFSTGGVGREELLRQLAGQGDLQLSKIELRGWDVRASTEAGVARTGTSRWTSGAGTFEIGEEELRFAAIQLDGPQVRTQLSGALGFDMSGEVTFLPDGEGKRGAKMAQASRGLSLSGPLETPKVIVEPVSAETARP